MTDVQLPIELMANGQDISHRRTRRPFSAHCTPGEGTKKPETGCKNFTETETAKGTTRNQRPPKTIQRSQKHCTQTGRERSENRNNTKVKKENLTEVPRKQKKKKPKFISCKPQKICWGSKTTDKKLIEHYQHRRTVGAE